MAPNGKKASHPMALAHLEECLVKMLVVHIRLIKEGMQNNLPAEFMHMAAKELVELAKEKITDKVVVTIQSESANIPVPSLN